MFCCSSPFSCWHYTRFHSRGPVQRDQPGRTGGDGGIQCVPAPALVRGEVQVDRHSIAVLGLSCSHSSKPFQMPKPNMHRSIGHIPGHETCSLTASCAAFLSSRLMLWAIECNSSGIIGSSIVMPPTFRSSEYWLLLALLIRRLCSRSWLHLPRRFPQQL